MDKYYYYSHKSTEEFLNSKEKRVYLYGGSPGMSNFGDIIQLKSVIYYYRKVFNIEPVIFFLTQYIEDKYHVQRFKSQYNCKNLVFISGRPINAKRADLSILRTIRPGGLMHIYGGGYLNANWGDDHIKRITDILATFNISDYLFSGEQVGTEIVERLDELFKLKKPLIFGVRDKESYDTMLKSTLGSRVQFSFDDSIEIFQLWKEHSTPNLKTRLIDIIRQSSIMLHLNFSYYSNDKEHILSTINLIKERYPNKKLIVAQGWTDIRALHVKDGLSAIVQLKDQFPYTNYGVADFVRMAYQINPVRDRYPNLSRSLNNVDMAVSCSYHLALLLMIFEKPVYLVSTNRFYSQKQKGLGINTSYRDYIENPHKKVYNISAQLRQRKQWLCELENIIEAANSELEREIKQISNLSVEDISLLPKIKFLSPNA